MVTRRASIATFGLAAASGALLASPARAATTVNVVARRKQITLPAVPALGAPYIATFDLFDEAGAKIGDAAANSSVVDVTLAGPVVFSTVILRLADGQIHYQRMMDRFGDYPRRALGAVQGGTGAYAGATGDVEIVWPDADTIAVAVRLPG